MNDAQLPPSNHHILLHKHKTDWPTGLSLHPSAPLTTSFPPQKSMSPETERLPQGAQSWHHPSWVEFRSTCKNSWLTDDDLDWKALKTSTKNAFNHKNLTRYRGAALNCESACCFGAHRYYLLVSLCLLKRKQWRIQCAQLCPFHQTKQWSQRRAVCSGKTSMVRAGVRIKTQSSRAPLQAPSSSQAVYKSILGGDPDARFIV